MRRSICFVSFAFAGLVGLAGGCSATPAEVASACDTRRYGGDSFPAGGQVLTFAKHEEANTTAPYHWQRLPGLAIDIAAGPNGGLWVIGVDARPGGFGIYRWNGYHFKQVPGAGVRIALDPQGRPWVVNEQHRIYRLTDGAHWEQLPRAARDIGIGADGSVWVIGIDRQPGGYGIHRFTGAGWEQLPGGGVRIAVGPAGEPWVIDNLHLIRRRSGGHWQTFPGEARDIGISAQGEAWITGRDPLPGGYGIYRWAGEGWSQVSGAAVHISVGPSDPWVVNAGHGIYRTL